MEQRNPRLRWLVVWVLAVVWMVAVLARLSYLQLFCYSEYLAKAQHQQQRIFEISPKRGTIYDRKGRELAVSLPMDSVFARPSGNHRRRTWWRGCFRAFWTFPPTISKRKSAKRTRRCAWRKSFLRKPCSESTDMNLRASSSRKKTGACIRSGSLAASVLGYVDVDEKGIGGIEYSLDKQIRGRPGKMMVMADGRRRWYDRTEAAADPGASVTLTIDETIQYIAEKELARAIEETHAKAGTVVVQDPNYGRTAGGGQLADVRSQRSRAAIPTKRAWTAPSAQLTSRARPSR